MSRTAQPHADDFKNCVELWKRELGWGAPNRQSNGGDQPCQQFHVQRLMLRAFSKWIVSYSMALSCVYLRFRKLLGGLIVDGQNIIIFVIESHGKQAPQERFPAEHLVFNNTRTRLGQNKKQNTKQPPKKPSFFRLGAAAPPGGHQPPYMHKICRCSQEVRPNL